MLKVLLKVLVPNISYWDPAPFLLFFHHSKEAQKPHEPFARALTSQVRMHARFSIIFLLPVSVGVGVENVSLNPIRVGTKIRKNV